MRRVSFFRIHDCIRVRRSDYLLAETDDSARPYIVWQVRRILALTLHIRRRRHIDYDGALSDLASRAQHIPRAGKCLSETDCQPGAFRQDYAGKIVTIAPMVLKEAHRRAENQLQIARSGQGCKPDCWREPVYCESLCHGHKSVWRRQDILGVARLERLPRRARKRIRQEKR